MCMHVLGKCGMVGPTRYTIFFIFFLSTLSPLLSVGVCYGLPPLVSLYSYFPYLLTVLPHEVNKLLEGEGQSQSRKTKIRLIQSE
jgi:hypothetical protein